MALKDADLIVAADSELRITSLWDAKLGRETGKSYKVCRSTHTVRLDIQINTRCSTSQPSTFKYTNSH